MAKRRGRRDNFTIANDPLSVLVSPSPVTSLLPIEDRRSYHPDGPDRPVLSVSGVPSFVTLEPEVNRNASSRKERQRTQSTKARLVFQAPQTGMERVGKLLPETAICVRRSTRREVLFAKGKGGSRHRRRVRRNRNSDIGC